MRHITPLLLATLCLLPTARAGPWVRPAGGVWVQAGPSLFDGSEQISGGDFEGRAIELYGEIGVGAGVELIASGRLVDHRLTMPGLTPTDPPQTRRVSGWGDVEALFEWALFEGAQVEGAQVEGAQFEGAAVLALRGGLRLSPYRAPSVAARAAGTPTPGPGGVDVLVGAGWGRSLGRGWAAVEVRHRARLGCVCNAMDLRLELGGFAAPWLGLAATTRWQPAYGRDADLPPGAPAPIPSDGSLGGKLFARFGAGLGALLSYDWTPGLLADGPGQRVALTLTWERAPPASSPP